MDKCVKRVREDDSPHQDRDALLCLSMIMFFVEKDWLGLMRSK